MGAAVYVSLVVAPGAIIGAGLASRRVTIALIDGRGFIIPDWLNAAGIVLAMVYAAVGPEAMGQAVVVALLRGLAIALVIFLVRYGYAKLRGAWIPETSSSLRCGGTGTTRATIPLRSS